MFKKYKFGIVGWLIVGMLNSLLKWWDKYGKYDYKY